MKNSALDAAKLYIFDLDGTVYLGGRLIPGAAETLARLRENGKTVCFLTNNSSRSRQNYIDKLSALGIPCTSEDIVTSTDAACDHIAAHLPDTRFFVLGTAALVMDLQRAGVCVCGVSEAHSAGGVILGYDTELTYEKLAAASNLICSGAAYVATHADLVCPAEPYYLPDAGSMIALLEKSTGRLPDVICGKPNAQMAQTVLRRFGARADQTVMVGDRLTTDMAFAKNCNFTSVLVLTGETTAEMAAKSEIKPNYILDSICDILD